MGEADASLPHGVTELRQRFAEISRFLATVNAWPDEVRRRTPCECDELVPIDINGWIHDPIRIIYSLTLDCRKELSKMDLNRT